jgi:hypothetical protein
VFADLIALLMSGHEPDVVQAYVYGDALLNVSEAGIVADTVVDPPVVIGLDERLTVIGWPVLGPTVNAVEVPLPVLPVMSFTVTANTQVDVRLEDVAPAV